MSISDLDGNPLTLQPGDILFYDTSHRWPQPYRVGAPHNQRKLDNKLIRTIQGSPITHAAVVTYVNGENVKIVDIVADRVVNEHEVREGDFRLEGTVLRPDGMHADDLSARIVWLAKSHVGDNNIGFPFSRAKTWGTKFFCCMNKAKKPYEKGKYGEFILNTLYPQRERQCWGQTDNTFDTYCAEFIGILITLATKELLEEKGQIQYYDDWLNTFAKQIYRTTTTDLHKNLLALSHESDNPISFTTYGWQNEFSLHAKKNEADENQPLLN